MGMETGQSKARKLLSCPILENKDCCRDLLYVRISNKERRNSMAVTIKDVARESGLAISTISKYMNGGNVRKQNREKIELAIEKLEYVPNVAARGMRTFKTYTVGLIIGGARNQHTSELISEIEKELTTLGYSLVFIALGGGSDESGAQVKEYVDYMVNHGVDGIIVTPPQKDADYWAGAREKEIPVVLLEEREDRRTTDSVLVNCTGASYLLVEHLIKMGHSRIGILMGQEGKLTADERRIGYERALTDYGIPIRKKYMIQGTFEYRSGYEGIKKLWKVEKKPTAVFATNYNICLGAMKAIHELGISISDDLSFVTFDDFDMWTVFQPRLTAVRQPLAQLAKEASQILYRRMNGDYQDFPRVVRLEAACQYRNSVKNLWEK